MTAQWKDSKKQSVLIEIDSSLYNFFSLVFRFFSYIAVYKPGTPANIYSETTYVRLDCCFLLSHSTWNTQCSEVDSTYATLAISHLN